MRETLISVLRLKPVEGNNEVSDNQIVTAVTELQRRADAATEVAKNEKAIADLIKQSYGAISRDCAKEIIAERAANAARSNQTPQ